MPWGSLGEGSKAACAAGQVHRLLDYHLQVLRLRESDCFSRVSGRAVCREAMVFSETTGSRTRGPHVLASYSTAPCKTPYDVVYYMEVIGDSAKSAGPRQLRQRRLHRRLRRLQRAQSCASNNRTINARESLRDMPPLKYMQCNTKTRPAVIRL